MDADWEEVQVTTDIRETRDGHLGKRAHLRRGLVAGEEPILGLFLRFFPMEMYEEHLEKLRKETAGLGQPGTSRHVVKWDKGTFLRFLGLLLRFTVVPLANMEWHWRWPADVPDMGVRDVKNIMTEVVFKKFWAKATVPGAEATEQEEAEEVDIRSPIY